MADLDAVRRTDALIDSLAARRAAGSPTRPLPGSEPGRPRPPEESDPAVRLLRALIEDVDDPGADRDTGPETSPPSPPAPEPDPGPGQGPRRRGPRTIVALGVAGAVLASTGVAAAGGVSDHRSSAAAPGPSTGAPGEARTAVRSDTDAGTYERPRPPARQPAPEPERPEPSPSRAQSPSTAPSGGPEAGEGEEPRTYFPFPIGPRPHYPEGPSMSVQSTRPPATGYPSGTPGKTPGDHRKRKRYPGHTGHPEGDRRYGDRD